MQDVNMFFIFFELLLSLFILLHAHVYRFGFGSSYTIVSKDKCSYILEVKVVCLIILDLTLFLCSYDLCTVTKFTFVLASAYGRLLQSNQRARSLLRMMY